MARPDRCGSSSDARCARRGRDRDDGLEGRLELAIQRAERERPESWEQAAARLVMNEVEFRALLADIAVDDPYAELAVDDRTRPHRVRRRF